MAISYSALTSYGKTTLPSVESWGTNMNIIKDPPKSIMTRRKDKVGSTSIIQEQIGDSGDRTCEAIQVYARGVNPMVSVSYSNSGNNGGQRSGGMNVSSSGQVTGNVQARSMYPIMKDGAFRFPARTAEQNAPLSRQPRQWTSASTQKSYIDFSKKLMVPQSGDIMKEIQNIQQTDTRPTKVYNIQRTLIQPFDVKYIIREPINIGVSSGIRTQDITNQVVRRPTKGADGNEIGTVSARTNVGAYGQGIESAETYMDTKRYLQDVNNIEKRANVAGFEKESVETHVDTQRYLQDIHNINMKTNASKPQSDVQTSSFNIDVSTKTPINVTYNTVKSSTASQRYDATEHDLKRVLPQHSAGTNLQHNIYKKPVESVVSELVRNRPITSVTVNSNGLGETVIGGRDYQLAPSLDLGGFDGKAQAPLLERAQGKTSHASTDKKRMIAQKIYDEQEGRNDNTNLRYQR
jgi:hypothetical protein